MGSSRSTRPAHLATYTPLDNSARRTTLALSSPQTRNTRFQHCARSRSRAAWGEGAVVAHHTLSRSPAHLRYNHAQKNEDGAATVLVLVPAQTRPHGHRRSQVQSGGLAHL